MSHLPWQRIVEIQYEYWIKSSMFFIAILGALLTFIASTKLELSNLANFFLFVSFVLVLWWHYLSLELVNIQRNASWFAENNNKEKTDKYNNLETKKRKFLLKIVMVSVLMIIMAVFCMIFNVSLLVTGLVCH